MGKRITLAMAKIHTACRTAAEHLRSSTDTAAANIRMRVGLAITSSATLISCLLYEPCRSILGAGLVLLLKAHKTTRRAAQPLLVLESHRRTSAQDDGSQNASPAPARVLA